MDDSDKVHLNRLRELFRLLETAQDRGVVKSRDVVRLLEPLLSTLVAQSGLRFMNLSEKDMNPDLESATRSVQDGINSEFPELNRFIARIIRENSSPSR